MMKLPRPTSRTLFPAALFFLAALLAACFVDRAGTASSSETISPTLICPGDAVALSWSTTLTAPSRMLNVTSIPDLFAPGDFPTGLYPGSMAVNPTEDTTFSFTHSSDGAAYRTASYGVEMILPDQTLTKDGTFSGSCAGARAGWEPLVPHEDPSGRVTLTEICNRSTEAIIVRTARGADVEIPAMSCRPVEESPQDALTLISAPRAALGALCGGEVERVPRSVPVQLQLVCKQ